LYRYFADEVFGQEPPEIREFMLRASVPASLDVRTARDVLAFAEPERALEHLEEEGLLQRAPGDHALRFHPLLRSFLRHKLVVESPGLAAATSALVIEDARRAARLEEAFELALEAGRLDDAIDVAAQAAPGLLDAGRIETIERWLVACGTVTLD